MTLEKIRVLIVDDSPFSQKVLSNALNGPMFEVCGFAESGWEAVDRYRELKPDIVTMDFTLPDIDGFVCSSEIIRADSAAKIIMISSMKDDSLIAKGYGIGIKAFLQKPPVTQELTSIIQSVVSSSEDLLEWQDKYLEHFIKALSDNLMNLASLRADVTIHSDSEPRFMSQGVAIIIGISGKQRGRIIVDASEQTATEFTKRVFGSAAAVSEDDVLNSMAEFANIVGGHGVSDINDIYRGMDFRLAPPSMLSGKEISIVNPKLSSFIAVAETEIGPIKMSVGFAGGK